MLIIYGSLNALNVFWHKSTQATILRQILPSMDAIISTDLMAIARPIRCLLWQTLSILYPYDTSLYLMMVMFLTFHIRHHNQVPPKLGECQFNLTAILYPIIHKASVAVYYAIKHTNPPNFHERSCWL